MIMVCNIGDKLLKIIYLYLKEIDMTNEQFIVNIQQSMLQILNNAQLIELERVLKEQLLAKSIVDSEPTENLLNKNSNNELIEKFIAAKCVEGCSKATLRYYKQTLSSAVLDLNKPVTEIVTDDLRDYLKNYEDIHQCSKTNIDNIRRILSSFFSWLEDEDFIIKSPVRRIHKIKTKKTVKETFSDESLEKMRDSCSNLRDLAMIDMLASTGMRVGELVGLNIADVDFENRECVVLGKGNKQRPVYFDARTKIHLSNYLKTRTDDNPALFVSLLDSSKRLKISGVEIRIRKIGQSVGIEKSHPHKFRRTLATKAIDKGMPVEQVQQLLGHSKIDTTMQYAMVNQSNVKQSHRRYIS